MFGFRSGLACWNTFFFPIYGHVLVHVHVHMHDWSPAPAVPRGLLLLWPLWWLLSRLQKWAVTSLWGFGWNLHLTTDWPTNKAPRPDMSINTPEKKKGKKVKAQYFLQLREADDLVLFVRLLACEHQWSMHSWVRMREMESWGVWLRVWGLIVCVCKRGWRGVTISIICPEEGTENKSGGWGGDGEWETIGEECIPLTLQIKSWTQALKMMLSK